MATRTRTSRRTTLSTGPWKSVRDTSDPLDGTPEELVDAQNMYIPDSQGGSGLYARRGFGVLDLQDPYMGRGQGVYDHVVAGSSYNFVCTGGRLLRANAGLTAFTDVTPIGVLIDPNTTHVYFTTLEEKFIISDGVNNPWIAGDLDNTPITGTVIDYNGTGVPGSGDTWSATGQPVIYAGSLFFIVRSIAGVLQPPTIAWSAPGNPAQGYFQNDGALNAFDYTWTLEETNDHPLYGLASTNTALYYFRDKSIGAVAGTPGPDLQGSSSKDVVSVDIGCLQSATIQQYGQAIFFCDQLGRPYVLQPGSPPIPLWLAMRQVVDDSTYQYPTASAQVSIATIHPILNLYIVAPWSPTAGVADAPVEAYCFDTKTFGYVGRWSIRNGATWEAMGILNNAGGYASLVVLGDEPPDDVLGQLITTQSGLHLTTQSGIRLSTIDGTTGRTGIIWGMNATIGDGDPITSEDGLYIITSEDGIEITSENELISWEDDGVPPIRSLTTQRMGYSADQVYNVDQVTIITQSPAPCTVTMMTPTTSGTVEGTPTPGASLDQTYRLVCGADVQGRGIQVTVSPTTADDQWIVQSVGIVVVPSLAGPEEW